MNLNATTVADALYDGMVLDPESLSDRVARLIVAANHTLQGGSHLNLAAAMRDLDKYYNIVDYDEEG